MSVSITKEKTELREAIMNVFPKNDPPFSGDITVDDHSEFAPLKRSFDGIPWWLVPSDIIDANYDNLPLFTPHAFHYYLPSFLLRSLDKFDRYNLTLEFTLYNLSPTKTASDDPGFRKRYELFSVDEVNIIRSFLELILADETLYGLYEPAERALRKFWTLPSTP